MAESERISYHVTTSQTEFQNRSQIFVSGTRSARFESEKKPLLLLFLTSEKSLPVPPTKSVGQNVCIILRNKLIDKEIIKMYEPNDTVNLIGIRIEMNGSGLRACVYSTSKTAVCVYQRRYRITIRGN